MFEYCPINEMPHELFPFQKVCLDIANSSWCKGCPSLKNDAIFTKKVFIFESHKSREIDA